MGVVEFLLFHNGPRQGLVISYTVHTVLEGAVTLTLYPVMVKGFIRERGEELGYGGREKEGERMREKEREGEREEREGERREER